MSRRRYILYDKSFGRGVMANGVFALLTGDGSISEPGLVSTLTPVFLPIHYSFPRQFIQNNFTQLTWQQHRVNPVTTSTFNSSLLTLPSNFFPKVNLSICVTVQACDHQGVFWDIGRYRMDIYIIFRSKNIFFLKTYFIVFYFNW